ncbi:hypothetical protein Pelo_19707 [Pelomyxa schiedti]|nr:hypothetical protein Pelo_19707 [Pelomyxa schiedti]
MATQRCLLGLFPPCLQSEEHDYDDVLQHGGNHSPAPVAQDLAHPNHTQILPLPSHSVNNTSSPFPVLWLLDHNIPPGIHPREPLALAQPRPAHHAAAAPAASRPRRHLGHERHAVQRPLPFLVRDEVGPQVQHNEEVGGDRAEPVAHNQPDEVRARAHRPRRARGAAARVAACKQRRHHVDTPV